MAGGPEPPRYAYATIMFNTVEEPYLEDYIIGPLGSPNETTYGPYSFTTTKGTSRVRNFDADEDRTYEFFSATAATCDDIFEDLIGARAENTTYGVSILYGTKKGGSSRGSGLGAARRASSTVRRCSRRAST